MPKQKPGASKQDYGTPWWLIRAIEKQLGRKFDVDLAASPENMKAVECLTKKHDSLNYPWAETFDDKLCWLNPPFARIAPWVEKAYEETRESHLKIVMLVPAAVGSNWFANFVYDKARVLFLRPRFAFEGQEVNPNTGKADPYPKDCMLLL